MAVAFGSAGAYLAYAGSRGSSTLAAPSGISDGDFLIAFLANARGSAAITPTPPAGWSTLPGSPITNTDAGSFILKFNVFYKIASGESGSYTFDHSDFPNYSSCGIIARYTGVDTSTPLSPSPTTNSGTGATATATGFTTVNENTLIIFAEQDWSDNTTDCTPPAGTTPTFTERLDAVLIYVADGTLASAGSTGNKSHTCNTTGSNPWAAFLIGLNPAAGGGVAPVTLNANPGSYTLTGTPAALGRQIINVGSAINDGTGDPARVAFTKCNSNFADLYAADTAFLTTAAAAATYQPLDADLTAIAALTGTNTIYYRSASNVWSPVVVSTGLSFSGGNLTATGGGGNVSNSGTPAAGQLGEWVTATTIKGIAKTSLPFLPLTGVTDGSDAPAGYIGEIQQAASAAGYIASSVWYALVGVTLTPGDWDVDGYTDFYLNNDPSWAYCYVTIADAAGSGGYSGAMTQQGWYGGTGQGWNTWRTNARVSLAVTTTVYICAYCSFTAPNCLVQAFIRARRAR